MTWLMNTHEYFNIVELNTLYCTTNLLHNFGIVLVLKPEEKKFVIKVKFSFVSEVIKTLLVY